MLIKNYKPYFLFISVFLAFALWIKWEAKPVNWVGFFIICLGYLLIFIVGVKSSSKSKDDSSDNFLLAGRKLPLWIAILTMAATWLGGGYINGTAEAAAESGLVWVQAPWGYGLSLIIGGLFFAKKMRRYQFRTMLDPLSQRFGDKTSALFFVPAALGEIFWVAAILTALGTTFSVIIGIDTQISILFSASVAIIYTFLGGLWSVAYTDVIQLFLLIAGLLLALPFILPTVGNLDLLWTQYSEKFGEQAGFIPDPKSMGNYFWNWVDIGLLLIFGGIPWQVYFQRVLAAKDEKTAVWLSIIAGFICIIVAVPAAMIGMVGAVTDWSAIGLSGPISNASILPYVFQYLTPGTIALVGLGAIAAAVMSSIDSSMLSASTLTTWNIYRPLFKPDINSRAIKKTIQKCIVIVGVSSALIALKVTSVYALWYLCSDLVYCLLFPALLLALFDSKVNKTGAITGLVVSAVLRIGGGDTTLGIPITIPYPMIEDGQVLFPFRTLSMVSGLLTMMIVSRLTNARDPAKVLKIVDLEK